jgi:hypothetical protein
VLTLCLRPLHPNPLLPISDLTSNAAPAPTAIGRRGSWWLSAWLVVPLLALVVLASRLPSIRFNDELNVDESLMLAQGLRLGVDSVPWRGADATTSGPVNYWIFFLSHEFGIKLDYAYAHGVAAVFLAAICILTYAALRQVASPGPSTAAGALLAVFLALSQEEDFVHYSSELMPSLLAAGVLLCAALRFRHPARRLALDFCAGLLLGLMPFSKLQSILGAGIMALWFGGQILREAFAEGPGSWGRRLRPALVFGIAGLLPAGFILGTVAGVGAWEDFWLSYVQGNLAYASSGGVSAILQRVGWLCTDQPVSVLLQGLAVFLVSWLLTRFTGWKSAGLPARKLLVVTALLAIAQLAAVVKPPFPFAHYQMLLFQPLCLLAGCILAIWFAGASTPCRKRLAALSFAMCLGALQWTNFLPAYTRAAALAVRPAKSDRSMAQFLARQIDSIAPEINGLAVWGWMPALYVLKQTPPASRHAICHYLLEPGPAMAHMRATFLVDIVRERPELIVDAVAPGCFVWNWDREGNLRRPDYRCRIDSFPELNEYVQRHYVLVSELGMKEAPVRCYLSREYLTRRGAPLPP